LRCQRHPSVTIRFFPGDHGVAQDADFFDLALEAFYPAEAYHQNYAANHPGSPYIMFNDAPKVAHLQQKFLELYTGK